MDKLVTLEKNLTKDCIWNESEQAFDCTGVTVYAEKYKFPIFILAGIILLFWIGRK